MRCLSCHRSCPRLRVPENCREEPFKGAIQRNHSGLPGSFLIPRFVVLPLGGSPETVSIFQFTFSIWNRSEVAGSLQMTRRQ